MTKHTASAPQLPPASIDFNALNDALRAGEPAEKALDTSVIEGTLALSADEAAVRAVQSAAEAPTLSGKTKAELAPIAKAEVVTHARDKDGNVIAFADATQPQMVEAIEAKRAGQPIIPAAAPSGAAEA